MNTNMKKSAVCILVAFLLTLALSSLTHLQAQSRFRDAADSLNWIQFMKRTGDLKFLSQQDLDSLRRLRLQKVVPDTSIRKPSVILKRRKS